MRVIIYLQAFLFSTFSKRYAIFNNARFLSKSYSLLSQVFLIQLFHYLPLCFAVFILIKRLENGKIKEKLDCLDYLLET